MEQKTRTALIWILEILKKHNVPYQIMGGFAAKVFGSKRELHDIDIDISETKFPLILPEIKEYITYGPARYQDGKWDLELVTLNYNGQEIDISGVDTLRISTKDRTQWVSYPEGFEAVTVNFEGLDIVLMHPRKLSAYKKMLDGKHQQEDIDAADKYIEMYKL